MPNSIQRMLSGLRVQDAPEQPYEEAHRPATRYEPDRHGTQEAFGRHPDFQHFGAHVTALTASLKAYVPRDAAARRDLDTFRDHVLTVDANGVNRHFGSQAAGVYGLGIETLERLVEAAAAPGTQPRDVRTEVLDLSHQIVKCPTAVVECLLSSARRLEPSPQGLTVKWDEIRQRIVEQTANEAVTSGEAEFLAVAGNSHIHLVRALQERLHERLELPMPFPRDPLASHSASPRLLEDCLRALKHALHPAAIAELLAEDYLAHLSERLQQNPTPPLTIERIDAAVDDLAQEFGIKPPASAVIQVDLDSGTCAAAVDPTLLARCFLLEHGALTKRSGASREFQKVGELGSSEEVVIRNGRLAWVMEAGEPRSLSGEDLAHLPRDALPPTAIARVIRNERSDDAVLSLGGDWLIDEEVADAMCDRLDDAQMRRYIDGRGNGPDAMAPLIRLRDALSARDRLGGTGRPVCWWLRLTRPGLRWADELLEQLGSSHGQDTVLGAHRLALEAALAPLTRNERRVLGAAFARVEALDADVFHLGEWVAATLQATSDQLPPAALSRLLADLSTDDGHIVANTDRGAALKASTLLTAATRLLAGSDAVDGRRRVLLKGLLGIEEGAPSRLLQMLWTHHSMASCAFVLESAWNAMAAAGLSVQEIQAAMTPSGDPADPWSPAVFEAWGLMAMELAQQGLTPQEVTAAVRHGQLRQRSTAEGPVWEQSFTFDIQSIAQADSESPAAPESPLNGAA